MIDDVLWLHKKDNAKFQSAIEQKDLTLCVKVGRVNVYLKV